MKSFLFLVLSLVFMAGCQKPAVDNKQNLEPQSLNLDWQFHRVTSGSEQPALDSPNWRTISIPHDWAIEDLPGTESPFSKEAGDAYDTGYTLGGEAWYYKEFELHQSDAKAAYLEFQGVYMNSEIYLNGVRVGGQHNGYVSFWLDVSEQLNPEGKNQLAVRVNNPELNSRWYSGSGIYRPVLLHLLPAAHIAPYQTKIETTPQPNGAAQISVNSLVQGEFSQLKVVYQVLDGEGQPMGHSVEVPPSANGDIQGQLSLANPQRWSLQNPTLYTLRESLVVAGETLQQREYEFGVREVTVDAQKGLLLNGQPVLLKGMNIHHDNYLLGAAAYKTAEWRKVKRIKEAGYNAIRTSHNPPSVELLRAADHLGLLVIVEAFDAWSQKKWDHINDYASVFASDWLIDLERLVRRDWNHPSVIFWSIGNEIPEQGSELGIETAKQLVAKVKALDKTRPVTIGANISGLWSDPFLNELDVVGYNYQEHNYLSDQARNPQRVLYGSETYASSAYQNWQLTLEHPFVLGEFVWTGWDYLGEASIGWTGYAAEWKGLAPYPWTLAYCGELDALGYKLPAAYYRDVLWQTGQNPISAFVLSPEPSFPTPKFDDGYLMWVYDDLHPSWSWPGYEERPLTVRVFSAHHKVALELNGKRIAEREMKPEDELSLEFKIPYQPGTLVAIGLNEKGEEQARWRLTTAGQPTQIQLNAEPSEFKADGESLLYVAAELYDSKGNRVYNWQQDQTLSFAVEGPAELIALGNANPMSVESFQGRQRETFRGRAVAVLRSQKGQTGAVKLIVSGEGLTSAEIEVISE